ncbi:MAG: hypothetical protein SH856_15225 [Flavobacteriales bacterium]|nr:hypothetical protein [Flavobacteriales bacterium]
MKKFLTVLCVLVAMNAIAQNVQPTSKVKAAFTTEQLATIPDQEIEFLNFAADNACMITMNPEKAGGLEDFLAAHPEVPSSVTAQTFNPLASGVQFHKTENQYFRIGDTGKTLFIYSKDKLDVLFERHKANLKH